MPTVRVSAPAVRGVPGDRAQGWAVLCLSPELLLRREGTGVETWPIKGTRPHCGRPPVAVAAELRRSEKDMASP